ncbi:MAG: metallophosphoesterase [Eubacteriaceae bacterium]|nr:metallophosphoesterase [Eubacteriaceae bacterium]
MRFLHMSDLHYNPSNDGRTTREIRKNLIEYLKELGDAAKADELIITGDYRNAAEQKEDEGEITEVVEFIKTIAKTVGITDVNHIHLIPGNHDRSRDDSEKEKMDRIRKNYDSNIGTFGNDKLEFLLGKFGYFNKVCDTLYGKNKPWDSTEKLHAYRFVGDTVLLYLNTAIMHNDDKDRKESRLIIGNDYLDQLLDEVESNYPDTPIVVLAHHSPDYFEREEKQAVEKIFEDHSNVTLYLCGDAHEEWVRKVNNVVEITLGCLKYGDHVDQSFLIGDTDTQQYIMYHWVGEWVRYEKVNKQIEAYFPLLPKVIDKEDFKKEQKRVKNEAMLPWLRNSPSIVGFFPDLFAFPNLKSEKKNEKFRDLDDLIKKNKDSHMVLTGEAGSGKTTLLRQMFLFKNNSGIFLYLHAKDLTISKNQMRPYQKFVWLLLTNKIKSDQQYIVLLDGIDEAYLDESAKDDFEKLIYSIDKLKNTKVWLGWRKDHFYHYKIDEPFQQLIGEIVSLCSWDEGMANDYVRNYSKAIKNQKLFKSYKNLTRNNQTIKKFCESPIQLALLVYLLDNKENEGVIEKALSNPDRAIYALYNMFFKQWVKKEKERGTSNLKKKEIRKALRGISERLYYGNQCKVKSSDTAISGLLTFSVLGDKIANGFSHRSFCAFFLADKAFHAVKAGDVDLIDTFSIPMRNDVTDFLKSAISGCDNNEIDQIQTNLINTYEQMDSPNKAILSESARNKLKKNADAHFVLKNEIIYLLSRITDPKNPPARVTRFLKEKNKTETDKYLLLDIAYAACLVGPKKIALKYAKAMEPDSEKARINRSWTMAYFGDVQANPHEYKDDQKDPWTKSRDVRMKRFQERKYKSLRFRLFDIPLLHSFYASRDWEDVNEKDYQIIKQAVIDDDVFSDEEKRFLEKKKNQLLKKYKKRLDRRR